MQSVSVDLQQTFEVGGGEYSSSWPRLWRPRRRCRRTSLRSNSSRNGERPQSRPENLGGSGAFTHPETLAGVKEGLNSQAVVSTNAGSLRDRTAWLGRQCGSSVSPPRIPCKQGILQGKSRAQARQTSRSSSFARNHRDLGRFPYKRNREFGLTEQGNRNSEQRRATHDADFRRSSTTTRSRPSVRPPAPPAPMGSREHTRAQRRHCRAGRQRPPPDH
jgi:hypothetical protein